MTARLSPTMAEALTTARRSGGLVYRKGGFWTAADAEPTGIDPHDRLPRWPWYATKGTVKALVDRGLLRWDRTEEYPRFDSAAVLVAETCPGDSPLRHAYCTGCGCECHWRPEATIDEIMEAL